MKQDNIALDGRRLGRIINSKIGKSACVYSLTQKNIILCGADISAGAFHKYYEIAAIPLWHKNTAGDCYKNLRTEYTLSSLEKWFLRRLVGGLGEPPPSRQRPVFWGDFVEIGTVNFDKFPQKSPETPTTSTTSTTQLPYRVTSPCLKKCVIF